MTENDIGATVIMKTRNAILLSLLLILIHGAPVTGKPVPVSTAPSLTNPPRGLNDSSPEAITFRFLLEKGDVLTVDGLHNFPGSNRALVRAEW